MNETDKEAAMAKLAAWANSDAGKLAMAKIQEVLEVFKKNLENSAKASQEDTQKKTDM